MPISAWVMLIVGCVVIYGGLAVTIAIAVKTNKK